MFPQILLVIAGFSILVYLVNRWLWRCFVSDPQWTPAIKTSLGFLLVSLSFSVAFCFWVRPYCPEEVSRWCTWFAFVLVGVVFELIVVALFMEIARWMTWRSRPSMGPENPGRRAFLRASAGTGALTAMAATGLALEEGRKLAVENVKVVIPGLDPRLTGFRIAQATDLHLGPILDGAFSRRVATMINALEPDVAVLTGDLVDGTVDVIGSMAMPLFSIKARHGCFMITGNHEYYAGEMAWCQHFADGGIRPLRNEHVVIEHDGTRLVLAGVDDLAGSRGGAGGGPDVVRALKGSPQGVPVVLLAHQPKMIHQVVGHGVALQLSGHTHGGQLWPFGLLVRLVQPAISGLHTFGETQLYVNQGTGFWGPPMRQGVPAEITLIELVPG
ncbi:MAG: metallophosphoesterase [Planctomycetota bacterium]